MSKAKSIVITTLLAIAIVVAAFFAAISFPVSNNVKRLNSIASNIHLGADFSGYAYTTVYPEGVITAEDYELVEEDKKADYEKCGGLYVEKSNENYSDVAQLKERVAADAKILNARYGQKAYSSYSVAVEDGVSIKISIPTNFTYASYKGYDAATRSTDLSAAQSALTSMTAYGALTLRTTDESITLTDANDKETKVDLTKLGKDEWTDVSLVSSASTYNIAYGYDDDLSLYIKSVSARRVASNSLITFKFTKEGVAMFKDITTRVAFSSSHNLYLFVGDRVLVNLSCESPIEQKSISLQTSDYASAQNSAFTINSVLAGNALNLKYQDIEKVSESTASYGDNAALLMFIASVLVLLGVVVLLIVKYKKLGIVVSVMAVAFALVELYALCLLSIQLTFGVLLTCFACLALFVVSNVALFGEVKRLTQSGRTMQASVKEAYKNLVMTVSDLHIVLVAVAIILAAVCAGEAAACGLIAVLGVVASYVLYWFTRFMWYVTSSPAKDKFKFAGLKRVTAV